MTNLTTSQLTSIAGNIDNDFLTRHFDFCTTNELDPYSTTVLAMTLGNAYGYIMGTLNGKGGNTYGGVDIDATTKNTLNQIDAAFAEILKLEARQC